VLGCNSIVGRVYPCQWIYSSRTSLTLVDMVFGRKGFLMNANLCSLIVS